MNDTKQIEEFISSWQETSLDAKKVFIDLKKHLEEKEGVEIFFNARPKISYSLRAKHKNQKNRELFAMVDIIDDDPKERWFSVCFFEDMIKDPEEKGDIIPDGLLGQDGYCFDLDNYIEDEILYIKSRLDDAFNSAKS